MQLDPLVPVPVVIVSAVVFVVVLVARLVRSGLNWHVGRWVLMVLLATAIVLDPATTSGGSEARRRAASVLFVVDSTSSMAAVDYEGFRQRLDGVRADILEIAGEFRGAHFALVRFDSQARMELPWTTNISALETAVSVIRQERAVYSQGSRLDLATPVIDAMLPGPSSGVSPYSIVFYFSDGEQRRLPRADQAHVDIATGMIIDSEDRVENPPTFLDLAAEVDGGAVLGYGTEAGARMIEFHGNDEVFTSRETPYVIDYSTDTTAISHIDEENLRGIADDLELPYLHRTEPGGLAGLASSLAADAPVVNDGSRETLDRLYWIPALGLLAVATWQCLVSIAERRATRTMLTPPAPTSSVEPARVPIPAVRVAADADEGSAA